MIFNFNEFVKESVDMNSFFVVCSKQEDVISLEGQKQIVDMLVEDWRKLGVMDLIDDGLAFSSNKADQIIQRTTSRSGLYKKMSVSEFMQMLKES